jgi:acyl-CoA reductase-like NAD-dependent aldehyde dehydrogenase
LHERHDNSTLGPPGSEFTNDKATEERVLRSTISGGVTINNCMLHVAQHDLPFGGIGASGMGPVPRLRGLPRGLEAAARVHKSAVTDPRYVLPAVHPQAPGDPLDGDQAQALIPVFALTAT